MASPATVEEFLDLVHRSGVADDKRLDAHVARLRASGALPAEVARFAGLLVRDGFLTHFQAEHIAQGKWKRFTIGKYKVLEKLGSGGMGQVFLCEHKLMRCKRAIKILPTAKAEDKSALERFYREARAVAAIDHPNIVHAYDIDQDEKLHFLVMEYVDGSNLQDIVKKGGALSVLRACHYIRQAAVGLDHALRAGLVHRDIKPGNILVARDGAVKVLDMGLARFFTDEEDNLTRQFEENVLGTADYLAPEQAMDSHTVDIRADIYSLGATFYFILTGKTPFGEGTVAQKLFWHQSRQPRPIRDARPDVPAVIEAIILKMMAKDPAHRFQTPAELAETLVPFTQIAIDAPPEGEMPRLSPAATGRAGESSSDSGEATAVSKPVTPRALERMRNGGSGEKPPSGPPIRPMSLPPAAPSTSPGGAVILSNRPTAITTITNPHGYVRTEPPVQAPAVQLPPAAPEPEEEFAWQGLASDTDALVADGLDTAPLVGKPPPRAATRPAAVGEERAVAREKGIVILVVGLMVFAALLVVLVGGGLWIYFVLMAPAEPTTKTAPPLIVSAKEAGKPGVYRSISAALRVAPKDAVIEIADDVIEENLRYAADPRRSTEITIQAAPGREVVWRSASKDPATPLIHLTGTEFLKIKGLTLDGDLSARNKEKGKDRVKDLVLILGSCAGLEIEDVKFKDFGRAGVSVISAAGTLENPIRLMNLTALTAPALPDGSLVYVDAKLDMRIKQVEYLEASDLHGPAPLVRAENGTLGDHGVRLPGLKKE